MMKEDESAAVGMKIGMDNNRSLSTAWIIPRVPLVREVLAKRRRCEA